MAADRRDRATIGVHVARELGQGLGERDAGSVDAAFGRRIPMELLH